MKRSTVTLLLSLTLTLAVWSVEGAKRINRGPKNIEYYPDGSIALGSVFPDQGLVDPHSWVENGRVYVFCGHDESWRTEDTWRMDRWEIWSSDNLVDWRHERDILSTDTYIGDQPNCWAGDICERDGKYYWLFSNGHHNTGIMVADKITGPYRDLLGEPLLPTGIIKGKAYDPEVFIEDGEYYVCFGAGTYYIATLAKDMKSLSSEPQAIDVLHNGERVGTRDKSTLFKRDGWYYLIFGDKYAMSRSLYGPYELQERPSHGGHNSIFELNGHLYLIYEFGELYNFYRGSGLKPLHFDEEGLIYVPDSKIPYDPTCRFSYSQKGWCAEWGTTVEWNKRGYIEGKISEQGACISSIPYLRKSSKDGSISFDLRNESSSKRLRIWASSYDPVPMYWQSIEPIDWTTVPYVDVEIEPNSKQMQRIEVRISEFGDMLPQLRQMRIEPAADASTGRWAIDNMLIK